MNHKIKQLADQLGPVATIGSWGRVEWSDNVYPQLGDKLYAAIDLEKFAQLIVAECCAITDDLVNRNADGTWTSNELYTDYNGALFLAKRKIQETFGVEQ